MTTRSPLFLFFLSLVLTLAAAACDTSSDTPGADDTTTGATADTTASPADDTTAGACGNPDELQTAGDTEPTAGDPTAGLTWALRCDAMVAWDDADATCADLTWAGHDDWRLPTIDELRTLVVGCESLASCGECPARDGCEGGEAACFPSSCWESCDCSATATGCCAPPALDVTCPDGSPAASLACVQAWSSTRPSWATTDGVQQAWRMDFGGGALTLVRVDSVAAPLCVRTAP